jgi:hypothetical protein
VCDELVTTVRAPTQNPVEVLITALGKDDVYKPSVVVVLLDNRMHFHPLILTAGNLFI